MFRGSKRVGTWTATFYEMADGVYLSDLVTTPRKDRKDMRGLFAVWIVDPEIEEVTPVGPLVAKTEDGARIRALTDTKLKKDVEDYDVVVVRLGDVRKKEVVQKVEVVGR